KFYNIRILISSSLDGTIRMWDTSSGTCEIIIRFGLPINYIKLIDDDIKLQEEFGEQVPVILIEGKVHDYWRVDLERFIKAVKA
ncbi:MAG: hypothetical protein RL237_865, partial [Actinomycetota bacterium]